MSRFDHVWLTTDAQISALFDAYSHASLATKLLGTYNFPPDAAYIQGILTPWTRIPTIFVAEGILTIADHNIAFVPRRRFRFGWRILGLRSDLSFEFLASELTAVEAADIPSPVLRYFDIPFTRIRTMRAPPLDNFLISLAARAAMPRVRTQSFELQEQLKALASRSGEAREPGSAQIS
jgi:hypothetical protein